MDIVVRRAGCPTRDGARSAPLFATAMFAPAGVQATRNPSFGFAQFCANRLVRRESGPLPAIFFCLRESRPERPVGAGVDHQRDTPVATPSRSHRRKALVFRIRLKCIPDRGGGGRDAPPPQPRAAGRRTGGAGGRFFRAGVDSEKKRD
ncbi:hypothetical protein [Pseudoxanthomonas sp. Soil82]|uniref:hypothetical protein n=1 Tax=Pseudoxanthomonas sp. Soil82 TaxID=3157341 RepID=UPI00338E7A31